jgi:hypothetical protein
MIYSVNHLPPRSLFTTPLFNHLLSLQLQSPDLSQGSNFALLNINASSPLLQSIFLQSKFQRKGGFEITNIRESSESYSPRTFSTYHHFCFPTSVSIHGFLHQTLSSGQRTLLVSTGFIVVKTKRLKRHSKFLPSRSSLPNILIN